MTWWPLTQDSDGYMSVSVAILGWALGCQGGSLLPPTFTSKCISSLLYGIFHTSLNTLCFVWVTTNKSFFSRCERGLPIAQVQSISRLGSFTHEHSLTVEGIFCWGHVVHFANPLTLSRGELGKWNAQFLHCYTDSITVLMHLLKTIYCHIFSIYIKG